MNNEKSYMKSRQKFTVSNTDKNNLEQRTKRKILSNPLIINNLQFLENYNTLFRKRVTNFDDSDSYFKKSLRNNEELDLLREINKIAYLGRAKSTELVNKKKSGQYSLSVSSEFTSKPLVKFKKQRTVHTKFLDDRPSGSNLKSIYAPIGDLKKNTETEKTLDSKNSVNIMTEESESPEVGDEEFDGEEYEGEEGFDLSNVEDMIKKAEDELQKVAEESKDIMGDLKGEGEGEGGGEGEIADDSGSVFKYDPTIDSEIIKELNEAEKQARQTATVIKALRKRVCELMKKDTMTEAEAKELEEANIELKNEMKKFEDKTKRIQFLIGQANLFDQMVAPKTPLQKRHAEDMLPKVIVCGLAENFLPKIIVCDDKKKGKKKKCNPDCQGSDRRDDTGQDNSEKESRSPKSGRTSLNQSTKSSPKSSMSSSPRPQQLQQTMPMQQQMRPQQQMGMQYPMCFQQQMPMQQMGMQQFPMQQQLGMQQYPLQPQMINNCLCSQGDRFQSQSGNKEQTVESLQKQLTSLQDQMRSVGYENSVLNQKLHQTQIHIGSGRQMTECGGRTPCGKGKGVCPNDVQAQLQEYSETTNQLEKQLCAMECEVKELHRELVGVQKEREHLEHHRKMLENDCKPTCPKTPRTPSNSPRGPSPCPPCCGPPCNSPPSSPTNGDQRLKELREQYNRLEDDFKGKLVEVSCLRADNERNKKLATDAENAKKAIEEKLKELEKEIKLMKGGDKSLSKEEMIEREQQLNVAKQRFRDAQDELDELRSLIKDQQGQMDDYRNKYLEAQQTVEEQKRQIDMMDMESNRINEQVNLEIQRVKNQFQEKLLELEPLPDILKTTQIKLQEAIQMHLLAERNNEALSKELKLYKEKVIELANEMDKDKEGDQKSGLLEQLQECEEHRKNLEEELQQLKENYLTIEEMAEENLKVSDERLHQITQLTSQLENVREESARQVSRTKDRCETVRRSLQNTINDLERQLAQSRASAKAAQKDRDDIRQKMQAQINNLNENFEDAQMRIRNLQGHVNFLKSSSGSSYSSTLPQTKPPPADGCQCGSNY